MCQAVRAAWQAGCSWQAAQAGWRRAEGSTVELQLTLAPKASHPASIRSPCMSQDALFRAGSVESACTQLGPVPSSAPPASVAGSGDTPAPPACAACQPPATEPPGSCGSEESLQTPLDAALLEAPGGGSAAASAPAVQPPHEVAHTPPQQQAASAGPHPTVPPAFLAELGAANACVRHLPLPGKSGGPARGARWAPQSLPSAHTLGMMRGSIAAPCRTWGCPALHSPVPAVSVALLPAPLPCHCCRRPALLPGAPLLHDAAALGHLRWVPPWMAATD